MRLTNRRYTQTVHNLFLFSMLIVLFFLLLKVQKRIGDLQFYIAASFALLLVLYNLFFAAYFEYDSFGPTLQFRSKRFFKKFTDNKRRKLEIDKKDLQKYVVYDYFVHKSLILYISNKKSGKTKKVSFDITFLNARKINLMKQSLNKVLKNKSFDYN
ncbi:MAG TPA: hypothetical protein VFM82_03685 [Flavobacteriaceae bacterium]|nr:hypothetical protein [Flavobacteriaceae bacterium]